MKVTRVLTPKGSRVFLELSEKEYSILRGSFRADVDFYTGGSFGDGENLWDKKNYRLAQKMVTKLLS